MKNKLAKRRLAPALGLFFLSPLVGEFLLGNLPITWLWVLPPLSLMYGGGTLLIRETARRFKWGWSSIIVLCLAYGIVEEAFVTQSLFNPNYLGFHLLDYGYISSLGIGAWWTVYVMGIHTVWSTAVPIALVESFTSGSRQTPWLGRVGLTITGFLFLIGCLLLSINQPQESFTASGEQFLLSGLIVIIFLIFAAILNRNLSVESTNVQNLPSLLTVAGTSFALGSSFMVLATLIHNIPAALNVAGMIGLFSVGGFLFLNWSKREGWSEQYRLAIASGLLLVYVWYGFVQVPSTGEVSPTIDVIGNVFFSVGALTLLYFARKRVLKTNL